MGLPMSDTSARSSERAGQSPADGAVSTPGVEVRVLRPAQAPAAAAALVRGFDQEPAKVALLPDAALRRPWLETSIRTQLQEALRYGTVHGALVDGELAAVAVWLPPGVPKLTLRGAARALVALLGHAPAIARSTPRIMSVVLPDVPGGVTMARRRRGAVARAARGLTWRLDLLATLPEQRGRGAARSLLERQLRRCDQDGAAAWLETTDPVNVAIYERFGFATVGHSADLSWLPGLWVMRREPRTR